MKKENALFIGYHLIMLALVLLYLLEDVFSGLYFLLFFSSPISIIGIVAGSIISLFIIIMKDLDLQHYNTPYIVSIIISGIFAAMPLYLLDFDSMVIKIGGLLIPVIALAWIIMYTVEDNSERIVLFLSSPLVYCTLIWAAALALDKPLVAV